MVSGVTEWLASHGFGRPLDVADAFDWLVAEGAAGAPLDRCIDEAAGYAVVGHSFGANTSLAVAGATIDETALLAWAGLPMCPGGYEVMAPGLADITAPILTRESADP